MDLLKRFMGGDKAAAPAEVGAPAVEPRHLTGEEFDQVVSQNETPVVVDFWAEWCVPCHALAPAVAQMATEFEGQAVVAKLNADEYPEILERYGIIGIPTLIYFKGGEEVDRVVGVTPYGKLKVKMEQLLA